jgi:hypothetical protein
VCADAWGAILGLTPQQSRVFGEMKAVGDAPYSCHSMSTNSNINQLREMIKDGSPIPVIGNLRP